MTDLANRKGSVTQADYMTAPDQGVWAWSIFDPGATLSPMPGLPMHGSRGRDQILTATLDLEDMWASAIAKAVSKKSCTTFAMPRRYSAGPSRSRARLCPNSVRRVLSSLSATS